MNNSEEQNPLLSRLFLIQSSQQSYICTVRLYRVSKKTNKVY